MNEPESPESQQRAEEKPASTSASQPAAAAAASTAPSASRDTPSEQPATGQQDQVPPGEGRAGVVLDEENPRWRGLAFAFGTGVFVVIIFGWLILKPLVQALLGERAQVGEEGEAIAPVVHFMEYAFAGWVACAGLALLLHQWGKSTFWHISTTFGAVFLLMLALPIIAVTGESAWWWRAVYVIIVTACIWPAWIAFLTDRMRKRA